MNVDFGWQSVKVLYLFWITCSPLNLNSHTLSFLCLTRLTKPNLSFVSYSSQQRSIAQCFTHYIKERVFQIQLMFPLKIQFHSHFPLAVCLTTALTSFGLKNIENFDTLSSSDHMGYHVSISPQNECSDWMPWAPVSSYLIFYSLPSHIPSFLHCHRAGIKGVWLPNTGFKGVSHHHLSLFLF